MPDYKIRMDEDFGPVPNYKPYLILCSILIAVAIWTGVFICFWIGAYANEDNAGMRQYLPYTFIALAAMAAFAAIWSSLYVKTIQYHLNRTEVSWKRGVWFHTTGIVPYNRITDISINQGPVMRLFGISHLKIQTAGGGTAKGAPEIQIEGQIFAEELRAMIMDHVRGTGAANGATVGVAEPMRSDGDELLNEVREIRKLLEGKQR